MEGAAHLQRLWTRIEQHGAATHLVSIRMRSDSLQEAAGCLRRVEFIRSPAAPDLFKLCVHACLAVGRGCM